MGDMSIPSGMRVTTPASTSEICRPDKIVNPNPNPTPTISNPSLFSAASSQHLAVPDNGPTISALNSNVNPQRATAAQEPVNTLADSYLSQTEGAIKGEVEKFYATGAAKIAAPFVKKASEYGTDAINVVAPGLAAGIERRIATNGSGLIPAIGELPTAYAAVQDGGEAVDSLQNGQYLSGGLYTVSSAMNAGQFGAGVSRDLGIAGGAITSETGVGALVGGVDAAISELGAFGTGVIAFGTGVAADYAKKSGY